MAFGSGPKGYRGETDAAEKLTAVFYPDKSGRVVRTPGSGSFHGIPVLTGDVVMIAPDGTIDSRFPFYFEMKRYKKFSPTPWFFNEVGYLDGWLIKAEGLKHNKSYIPILMIRGNYSQWFMVFRHFDYEGMSDNFGPVTGIGDYSYLRCSVKGKSEAENDLVIMPFSVWKRWFKREVFVPE